MKHTLRSLVGDYMEYLTLEKNSSPKTVDSYGRYLGRLVGFAGDIEPHKLTVEVVRDYRKHLSTGFNLAPTSQNYHLIAARSFLRYLETRDINSAPWHKLEVGKQLHKEREILERDELLRLLEAPTTNNLVGLRDRALLETLFGTGLRVAELTSLSRNQVNLDTRQFTVRGKGRKDRLVFLSGRAVKWLELYLNSRTDTSEALFAEVATIAGNPISVRSVQRMVGHYAKVAGITKQVTPHTLRHCFATNLLTNGADLRYVQELLGHANIATTQQYTHLTNNDLKDAHARYTLI